MDTKGKKWGLPWRMPTYTLSVELWGQQKGHFPNVKLFLCREKEKQRLQATREPGAVLEAL